MTDKAKAGEQPPAECWELLAPPPEFVKEVAGWFRHRQGKPWPTAEMVQDFAKYLYNTKSRGEKSKEFHNSTQVKKANKTYKDFKKALDVIESFLYEYANWENLELYRDREIDEELKTYLDNNKLLYESAVKAKKHFEWIFERSMPRQGRRRWWEREAIDIINQIYDVWLSAGHTKTPSINPGGAFVHILVQALQYQGWDVNEAGISKWLEQKMEKPKKSRANSSEKREKSMGK